MREAVIKEIYHLMKKNKKVYFLTGDLGYGVVEEIARDFPANFVNVGVAEQNMIGIAAGLALAGKKVFVYSIIPFLTLRCFEQIRNDICCHQLDVILLGVGAGLSYGILGSTHFALEDIAVMRVLPNMQIFSPADQQEAILGIKYLSKQSGPGYLRIGKRTEPTIYEKPYRFQFGKINVLQEGGRAVVFATGPIIQEVLKAVDQIEKNTRQKISVVDVHTIKPLDEKGIIKAVEGKKVVFVVEEHYEIGGLGSAVAEVLSQYQKAIKLVKMAVPNQFFKQIGSQNYLRQFLKLDWQSLYQRMIKFLKV